MFVILYRWKIKPGREDEFISAWAAVTANFLEEWDSLGSRLHRGGDGCFYGYAQWRSAADRERAFAEATTSSADARMAAAIAERFEPLFLEPVADYLVLPEK